MKKVLYLIPFVLINCTTINNYTVVESKEPINYNKFNTKDLTKLKLDLIALQQKTIELETKLNRIESKVNIKQSFVVAGSTAVASGLLFNWNIIWSLLSKLFIAIIKKPLSKLWLKIKLKYKKFHNK